MLRFTHFTASRTSQPPKPLHQERPASDVQELLPTSRCLGCLRRRRWMRGARVVAAADVGALTKVCPKGALVARELRLERKRAIVEELMGKVASDGRAHVQAAARARDAGRAAAHRARARPMGRKGAARAAAPSSTFLGQ